MRHIRALGASAVVLFFATAQGSPASLDVKGRWKIVRAEGEAGTIDFASAEGGLTERHAGDESLTGTALEGGEKLFIAYRPTTTPGMVGALEGKHAAPAASMIDTYAYDAVEDCFFGAHGLVKESLRRPLEGNAVDLYVNGGEMFPSYLAAIREARETINCECYRWRDDDVGGTVGAALIERARAGVKVRVIMDGLASLHAKELAARMQQAGCEVRFWNPPGLAWASSPLDVDDRDHRKTMVVDGRVAFVGGMNLSHEYIHTWHDVHTRVRGPAVAAVQRHFVDTWRRMGGVVSDAGLYPELAKAGSLTVDVAATLPGQYDELKQIYLSKVNAAKEEICLETPFFGDDDLVKALRAARKRGVRVLLILPDDSVNAQKIMAAYHARIRPGLIAAGIEVRSYPIMTHGKVAVIDRKWATVGSCNLENRSFERDLEENVCIDDPGFAMEVRRRVFAVDVKASRLCKASDFVSDPGKRAFGLLGGMLRKYL